MAFGMKSKGALWVFTAFIIVGIYDFAAVYVFTGLPSVSIMSMSLGINFHVPEFVIGIVLGHLFFNMECKLPHK